MNSAQSSTPGTPGRVVVTGAGTGIGRATALAFAAQGASVIAVGRRPPPLAETAAAADPGGTGRIVPFAADLTEDGELLGAPPSAGALRIARGRLAVLDARIAAQTAARQRLARALDGAAEGAPEQPEHAQGANSGNTLGSRDY
jgi:NAD(P)-dependent dehydrogenase (short-subunit alcohol dehydrogenase family)